MQSLFTEQTIKRLMLFFGYYNYDFDRFDNTLTGIPKPWSPLINNMNYFCGRVQLIIHHKIELKILPENCKTKKTLFLYSNS